MPKTITYKLDGTAIEEIRFEIFRRDTTWWVRAWLPAYGNDGSRKTFKREAKIANLASLDGVQSNFDAAATQLIALEGIEP